MKLVVGWGERWQKTQLGYPGVAMTPMGTMARATLVGHRGSGSNPTQLTSSIGTIVSVMNLEGW